MRPYPLIFHPIFKQKIWGGRILEQFGKALPEGASIGESWELADVTDEAGVGQSVIANGPLQGMTLRQALASHGTMILGDAGGRFPLLIKYLDAHENLSVQVHPSESYAAEHPETAVKHEAWVILRSQPGAVIYLGLQPGVTRDRFLEELNRGNIESVLNAIPVQPGECYHVPSGTVHALGGGITLAEVQTSSDWTFRISDWGRERTAQRREMHIEKALQCIDFDAATDDVRPATAPPILVGDLRTDLLAETPHFSIERMSALADTAIDIVTSGMAEVWMVLSGRGQITIANEPILDIRCGMTVLMPAALSESEPAVAEVQRGTSILRVALPSPVKGLIA